MTIQELKKYLQHPEYLDRSTLSDMQQLVETYPYCAAFAILYAKNLHNVNDLRFGQFVKKAALSTFHREQLEQLLHQPAVAEQPITPAPTTIATENSYQLEAAEVPQSKPFKGQDLIDRFIANNPRIQLSDDKFEYEDPTAHAANETLSDTAFTESMAKIYIKQGQYVKALHIFEKLNLKYPEKSTYFADQIRFLNKIIQTNP